MCKFMISIKHPLRRPDENLSQLPLAPTVADTNVPDFSRCQFFDAQLSPLQLRQYHGQHAVDTFRLIRKLYPSFDRVIPNIPWTIALNKDNDTSNIHSFYMPSRAETYPSRISEVRILPTLNATTMPVHIPPIDSPATVSATAPTSSLGAPRRTDYPRSIVRTFAPPSGA
ncbi:hypothetical protein BX600DRAFT_31926 [Xylariales sp. PMI_506]|nr:hypothetical protein BX600DRAFT_31926 [Xylariales sp. PMI_506]